MATILALEKLYSDVRDRFATESPEVELLFGWKMPPTQLARPNRIIFKPGDPSNSAGEVGGAKYPGERGVVGAITGNPVGRPLATLYELFTVTIIASDPTGAADDELRQYKAARLLYDAWYRAVYLAARGTFRIVAQSWLGSIGIEQRYGAGIQVTCAIEAMIPDRSFVSAPAETVASIAVEMLDATDTVTAP